MDKRAAKKLALSECGAFLDVSAFDIAENCAEDPDNPLSATDQERLLDAIREVAAELIRRSEA